MPYQFSDALDDELLYERVETFGSGMDGFTRATLLAADASQYLENVLISDNLVARTRPGADTLSAAPNGAAVIGISYFDTPDYQQLIACSGGKLYAYEGGAWAELAGFSGLDAYEAAQGVDKLLISDGTAHCRSFDGVTFTDLGNTTGSTTSDPPVGTTILCWHAGRMFAAGAALGRDTIYASFLLEFGSGKWNHTNFSMRVGGGEGEAIVALVSLQNYYLAVLKDSSVYLVNTDPTAANAAAWAVQKVSGGVGCVGKKAWCLYANDLLFMARDGVRSLKRMQAAAGQFDISPPLSQPLQPWIERINWAYGSTIAAVSFRELCFFAVPIDSATTPDTVLVYNARLQCWLGVWTNWAPGCWAVSRFNAIQALNFGEAGGLVRKWKYGADAADDATYLDDGAAIPTKVWTRGFLFGEPVNDKDGYHAEARFSASNALVNFTLLADAAELRTWSVDLRQEGVGLPVDLPFDLADPTAQVARRGLRGLRAWNEAYLKIESTAGWWVLRNVSVSAYLNMLKNEDRSRGATADDTSGTTTGSTPARPETWTMLGMTWRENAAGLVQVLDEGAGGDGKWHTVRMVDGQLQWATEGEE